MSHVLTQEEGFSVNDVIHLAEQHYDLKVTAKRLQGEVDLNFQLQDLVTSTKYTLKISRSGCRKEIIQFQQEILQHLSQQGLPFDIPSMIPTPRGQQIIAIRDHQGNDRWLRLHQWVEGSMVSDINPKSQDLMQQWGHTAGLLARALWGFDHEEAHRQYKWDPSLTLASRKYASYIADPEDAALADHFWSLFEAKTLPLLPTLRMGVNYNDAHEHNLLAQYIDDGIQIVGVIDMGDALYTHTINELAIACAYACMYIPDPLDGAIQVVKGFNQALPLEDAELQVLYSLISARLLITVANAARMRYEEPSNTYLSIHEQPAWELLRKWKNIHPSLAHYSFRSACDLEPCPWHTVYREWCMSGAVTVHPLIDITEKKIIPINLDVGSLDLGNNANFLDIDTFERHIARHLEDRHADIGVGGYGEVRPFYTSDAYQVEGNGGVQWRTVHLGIDIWTSAGTKVYAPLDGVIHSYANNHGNCNYGPTLIVRHNVTAELIFYTLYGHLSLDSLDNVEIGMPVTQGQCIAYIGDRHVNGRWPPHLHFQVLLDDLGCEGDFPGVAYPHNRESWMSICPDPSILLPHLRWPAAVPCFSQDSIVAMRKKHLGSSLSVSYDAPLQIVRGYQQYLYDTSGRRYLDTVNNVAHVGHEHPRVVAAGQRQMAVLNTNTRYLHHQIVQYAAALLSTFPPSLCVVHFVNSGSEANELALRMARTYTSQQDMLAIEHAYHGNTAACIDISSYKFDGPGGQGAPPHTHLLPIPDCFRGMYTDHTKAGLTYADHANDAIQNIIKSGSGIAGFIAESILSCGGQIMLPQGYLSSVYAMVRAANGVCIADEVQVGFGRVGSHFWGFELYNVVPDIVTLGKPIGNGHALAAVVTTRQVADAFANGMEFFNTFGGNPVACAIGHEVLKTVEEEHLQANAANVGSYLLQQLNDLQESYPIIGDVRGIGLFLGIELVTDRINKTPAAKAATYLTNRMRDRGILMSVDGPYHNVIKIKPPMCFSIENADFLIENLTLILEEDRMQ